MTVHRNSAKFVRLCFRPTLAALIVAHFLLFAGGCGGVSQNDMKKFALKNTKDVDVPADAKAPDVKKAGAKNAVNPPAATSSPELAKSNKGAPKSVAKSSASPATKQSDPPSDDPVPAPAEVATETTEAKPIADTQTPPATPLPPDARARRTVENMTRIGDAFQTYLSEKTYYPAHAIRDRANAPILSWRVALLPYLGYKELHAQFRLDEPWNSRHNKALLAKIPSVYQSPERFDERTNYLVPVSVNTSFGRDLPAWPSTIEDGPRNTVFVVEADDAIAVPWTEPRDYELKIDALTRNLGTLRGDSFFVVWGTGEVGRILTTAPKPHLRAMFTFDAGEDFAAGKIDQPLFPASSTTMADVDNGGAAPRGAADASAAASAALSEKYIQRAEVEMAHGAEREASQWFYAAALTSPPGGPWANRYQWIPALKRPSPSMRFGIGLQYNGLRRSQLEQNAAKQIESGRKATWSSVTGKMGDAILQTLATHVERCRTSPVETSDSKSQRRAAIRAPQSARRPGLLSTSLHVTPLAPGVSYLAMADEPILREVARREGVDVLVLVDWRDVGHKQAVRVELIDTMRDVSVFQLPWIDSADVAEAASSPLADNPIAAGLRQLSEFLEQQLTMQPFPSQIQPRHVASRMTALATSKPDNPLATLAEMRYYRERGLTDDTQLLLAYQGLIGQKLGSELFLGDADTRERVLKPWLPPLPAASTALRTATANDDD